MVIYYSISFLISSHHGGENSNWNDYISLGKLPDLFPSCLVYLVLIYFAAYRRVFPHSQICPVHCGKVPWYGVWTWKLVHLLL